MLEGGIALLPQCLSSSETWTKGVQNGGQFETSQSLLGVTGELLQDGRSAGIFRARLAGCLDGDMGSGRGFLSPNALLGDGSILRHRVRETVLQVPSDAFRLEEINVLHKQVLRDPQEVLEGRVQAASVVSCGRFRSDVQFSLRGSEGPRRDFGPGYGEARHHQRTNQGVLERAVPTNGDLRLPHRLSSHCSIWDGPGHDPPKEDRFIEGGPHCSGTGGRLLEVGEIRREVRRQGGFSVGSLRPSETLDSRDVLGNKCDGESPLGMGHEERPHYDRHGLSSEVPQGSFEIRERKSDLALEGSSLAPIRLIDPRLGWFSVVRQLQWRASGESTRPLGTRDEAEAHQRQGSSGILELPQSFGALSREQSAPATGRFDDGEFGYQGFQGDDSLTFQKQRSSRGLGVGSGKELFYPAYRIRKHTRKRACGRRQQMGGHGGLGHFRPSLEIDRWSIRPSHFRQVRLMHQHSLPGFRLSMVPTRLPLAKLTHEALGTSTQQLLLPSRIVDTPSAQCDTAAERDSDPCDPRLSSEVVTNFSRDGGAEDAVTERRASLRSGAIRKGRAVEDSWQRAAEELHSSPSVSDLDSDNEGVVEKILDHSKDGLQYLVLWSGLETPTWNDKGGFFDVNGHCTCPVPFREYQDFLTSLCKPLTEVEPIRTTVSASNGDKYSVSKEQMQAHVAFVSTKAREAATLAAYHKLWNEVVLKHCHWKQLDPFDLTKDQLVNLLAWHEMQGKAGEVERLFNTIRVVYSLKSLNFPYSELAMEVVKGAKRIHAEEKSDVERVGYPVHEYKRLVSEKFGEFTSLRAALRDTLILCFGLRCMRRPSEISKAKRKQFMWVKPTVENWISPAGAPAGFGDKFLKVYIRSQKNDKEARGQWILVEPTWSEHCLCTRLYRYCEEFNIVIGASDQGDLPLFMSLVSPTPRGISSSAINSVVKRSCKMLGLVERITGHSLRIGGATQAAAVGLGIEIIRSIGGWLGDAVFRYVQAAAAPALMVSSKMGF